MEHTHILFDSDPHFKIDPITRRITNESSTKTTIIQHDHNSERFTFECPRYIEGHDLSLCNIVEVHYLNIEANTKNTNKGVYTIEDLQIKDDDANSVVCSWSVGNNATQFVGQLQFLIRFSCANEETGVIEYVWNTGVYSGINISSGIFNGDTDSDNPVPAFNFVTTINGEVLKFFVGTKEQYEALTEEEKSNLFALITDDTSKDDILNAIVEVETAIRNEYAKKVSTEDLKITKRNPVYTLTDETFGQNAYIQLQTEALEIIADRRNDEGEKFGLCIYPTTSYDNSKIGLTTHTKTGRSFTPLYGDHYLPAASDRKKGGIKSGGNIAVDTEGIVTVNYAQKAGCLTYKSNVIKLVNGTAEVILETAGWYGMSAYLNSFAYTFLIYINPNYDTSMSTVMSSGSDSDYYFTYNRNSDILSCYARTGGVEQLSSLPTLDVRITAFNG